MIYKDGKIYAPIKDGSGKYCHEVLSFSKELTKEAEVEIATKIEFMEEIFNKIEDLVIQTDIESVASNIKDLQQLHAKFGMKMFERKRKLSKND